MSLNKFRVWDKALNEYLNKNNFVIEPVKGDVLMIENNKIVCSNTDVVVERYTGLEDRKGVEIYEGDLVEVHDLDYSGWDFVNVVEIVYEQGSYYLKGTDYVEWNDILSGNTLEVTVVGNSNQNC